MPEKEDFLATARKRFAAAAEDEKELRRKFISDLKFASPDGDDQWDPQLKMQREQAGRPAMSFPRCHTFVAQVSNEARQNKPQVKFAPRRDADEDTAEVYEGLARYIQYTSDAQVAYETAIEYSAGGSFGYYRFLTDYCDDESDDLELRVVPVLDPLTVYGVLVPACFNRKVPFAFVIEDMTKEEFKRVYPDAEMTSIPWREVEKSGEGWVGSESVRIAEYWWVEEKRVKGQRRPTRVVKCCKTNGFEVLPGEDGESSETEWPGSTIPIIPVLGKQMIIEGKPRLTSIVTPQKSAQQLINYSKSRIAETLSVAPISPFMVAEGQIDGYEKEWSTLNRESRPFLRYKMVDVAGRPLPPPERNTFEPPIQALSAFVMQEIDDMKATTGIFDASLGNQANETSGQAIMRRQEQANLSTMHFMDNLERSFKQAGDLIAEIIPKIYDGEREIEILGEDESPKVVTINKPYTDESGKNRHYDLTKGKYSLVVTVGKAYGSKRAESFDTISQVVQTSPNMFPMIADILFRNSDMAGATELADRFHKMLPPGLQQDENNPIPPEAQAAVAQAQQQVQLLQGELQKLQFERQAKVAESQGKMQQIALQHQSDMALEDKKLQTQIAVAEIQTKAQILTEREQALAKLEAQFHDQAHDVAKQTHEHTHEAAMDAQNKRHEVAMAAAGAAQQQSLAVHGAQVKSALADQNAQATSAQSAQEAAQSQAAAQQQTESS
jgi:hypothetical protein